MKYLFQTIDVNDGQRPEYEIDSNPNWKTVLDSNDPDYLLNCICDWLNDEFDTTNSWCRMIIDGKTCNGTKIKEKLYDQFS